MSTIVNRDPIREGIGNPEAWLAAAQELAQRFSAEVIEAEQNGRPPYAELAAFKESPLVNLLIPVEYGGQGGTPSDAAAVISALAQYDPNFGAMAAYHYTNFIPDLVHLDNGNADLQRESASRRWLWGNSTQPFAPMRATPTGDGGYVLRGTKAYNTGALTSDRLTLLARRSDIDAFIYVSLDPTLAGVVRRDDWDAVGLRRSGTVTLDFQDAVITSADVLNDSDGPNRVTFPQLYSAPSNLYFAAIQVGAARGALLAATELYRAAQGSTPADEAVAQDVVGSLSSRIEAAAAYRDEVASELGAALARRRDIDDATAEDLTARAQGVRLFAAAVAINTGAAIYELPGVRAGAAEAGLDRFWRDARLHSLHINPPIYHYREIGARRLTGAVMTPPSLLGGPPDSADVGKPEASTITLTATSRRPDGALSEAVAHRLSLAASDAALETTPVEVPVQVGDPLRHAAQTVLDAAILVALADHSVRAMVAFTIARPVPRPVPGAARAVDDPFSQTLVGSATSEVNAAAAFVRSVAHQIDIGVFADASAASSRAAAALEVAARVALDQGERVWDVVGTSGSPRSSGFDKVWLLAQAVVGRHARSAGRRRLAQEYLAEVGDTPIGSAR